MLEKGMFYVLIQHYNVRTLLEEMLDLKLKKEFQTFFGEFQFVKSYNVAVRDMNIVHGAASGRMRKRSVDIKFGAVEPESDDSSQNLNDTKLNLSDSEIQVQVSALKFGNQSRRTMREVSKSSGNMLGK